MAKRYRVSVIVPVYNEEKHVQLGTPAINNVSGY